MMILAEYYGGGGCIVDSPGGLLCEDDDKEIILAVHELIDSVSTTVQTELTNDVDDLVSYIQSMLQYCFPPRVFLYRQEPQVLQEDVLNCLLVVALLAVTVVLLAPHFKCHKNAAMATAALGSKEGLHKRQNSSWNTTSNPGNSNNNNNTYDATTEEESDYSDTAPKQQQANYWWIGGEEENTDDDRFELMYDQMLQNAKYRRLILPPCCKKVNTPVATPTKQRGRDKSKSKATTTTPLSATTTTTTVSSTTPATRNATLHKRNEDDDPAARLQRYMRELYHFVRFVILFDFTAAARLLLEWYHGIRKLHNLTKSSMMTAAAPTTPPISLGHTTDGSCGIHNNNMPEETATAATTIASERSFLPETLTTTDDVATTSPASASATRSYEEPLKTTTGDYATGGGSPARSRLASSGDNTTGGSPARSRQASIDVLQLDRPPCTDINVDMDDENDCGASSDDDDQSHYFFDAPSSQHSLTKIQVPIPDHNGYISLQDEFLHDGSNDTPLLVFVNSRSGPQQGILLLSQLRRILNPIQVWDLADGGPERVLQSFLQFTKLRILVCGGDGTVAWIVSALERFQKWPPIAILPLGTGNDLARIHGWGGGYNNESLIRILEQIDSSYVSLLDRWQVQIQDLSSSTAAAASSASSSSTSTTASSSASSGKKTTSTVIPTTEKAFFNYMGVGADAQASLHVHYLRESRPEWFFSRLVNKAFYGVFGAEDIIKANNRPLRKELTLMADGVPVPLPSDSQGIILLNIDSYAGGVPLWSHGTHPTTATTTTTGHDTNNRRNINNRMSFGEMTRCESSDDILHNSGLTAQERFEKVTACQRPSSCQDGYLDVISIRGAFHLGQIKVGLSNAQRLCQCREAVITIKNQVSVQVDGEPWRQKSSRLTIRRKKDPAVMLHRSADDGGIETEVCSLLDWAEERKMIDRQIHAALMKEFSRRIEGRTRQRRNRDTGVMSTLKKAISSGAIASSASSTLLQQHQQQQKGLWYQAGGMCTY